ncbi:MAG: hypothetical protein CSA24_02835 [Deltaproteobacteria bacterium]|nr:MAG: hypothetical protein CSB49_03295 [Pseudomonadota bacterium]PIE65229.1 MAG: hypothetical protein CSA24_02835 [Deltaproteobacteria bacterium]
MRSKSISLVTSGVLIAALALFAAGVARAELSPMTAEQRRILYGSAEDKLDKKPCVDTRRRVMLHCKDVRHYVRMNEWYHNIWYPYLKGIGGGYVGVGSDQGLTFIAWARSEYAWQMDYDPVVVRVNLIHKALIKAAPTVDAYMALWERKGQKRALAAIAKEHASRKDLALVKRIYKRYRPEIRGAIRRAYRQKRRQRSYWLHKAEDYAYIRKLHQLDRIRIMGGDLLKNTSLIGIGEAARKLGIKMRVVYTSNAEEFWPYPQNFRDNFIKMPMDAKSIIIRTRHTTKYGPRIGSYVYIVQSGKDFQRQLANKRTKGIWAMMRHRRAGRPGFFTIGMPVHPESMPKALRKR